MADNPKNNEGLNKSKENQPVSGGEPPDDQAGIPSESSDEVGGSESDKVASADERPSPPTGSEFSSEASAPPVPKGDVQENSPSKGALVKVEVKSVAERIRSDLVKKKSSAKDLKRAKTLSEHKNWYKDRYQSVVIQRNVLFFLTALALFGLGFSVTAVATLNASKIFEPFVIEVEEKTGMVAQVDNKTVQRYTGDETVINYFLSKYMLAREQYNFADFRYFYYNVTRLLSSSSVYSEFRGFLNSHPDSPTNLGRGTTRTIDIKSIVFLEPKKVQIRISTKDAGAQGAARDEGDYIITLNFDFLDLSLSREDRFVNPLGFQVTGYRRDVDKVDKGIVKR